MALLLPAQPFDQPFVEAVGRWRAAGTAGTAAIATRLASRLVSQLFTRVVIVLVWWIMIGVAFGDRRIESEQSRYLMAQRTVDDDVLILRRRAASRR